MDELALEYITKWQLKIAGAPKLTYTGFVLPVFYKDVPAVLKLSKEKDEKNAAACYEYWQGQGAVQLFEKSKNAILLERAEAKPNLADVVEEGQDNNASMIIAGVIKKLHSATSEIPRELVSLEDRFASLFASKHEEAKLLAKELLAKQTDVVVLHGDIHHENVMYSERGWLAIDPKGIIGERTYEAANVLCNPNILEEYVLNAKRMENCADIYTKMLGFNKKLLLQYTYVHATLAACWSVEDEIDDEDYWLKCASIAKSLIS